MIILRFSMQWEDKFMSGLKASVICLQFDMQEEDILQHTNDICVHFSQLVEHCVT